MNICILSMQRVNNMGSVLQSYSLKSILESFGHTVSFIDIASNENDNALMVDEGMRFNEEEEHKDKKSVLSKLAKIDRYAINRILIKQKDKTQRNLFEAFRTDELGISVGDNEKKYDLCIIGSDEVFNCAGIPTPWGFTGQMFGDVAQAERVITYAASCGAVTTDVLSDGVANRISEAFGKVSAFSVRDANTAEFIRELAGREPTMSFDPVVVGNFDKEMEQAEKTVKLPKRYCIVYSYYNRIHKKEEILQIKRFCKKHDLTPVSVGAPQMWIKHHLVLTPFEMLVAFKKAEFVFTDTFHGTIFASKYSKKFATIVRRSNFNKLSDLIDRLEINDHKIADISELDGKFEIVNDFETRERIINEGRSATEKYLKESI